MAIPLAASAAVASGIGMYLNGKYHIAKDIRALYTLKRGQRKFEEAKQKGEIDIFRSFVVQVQRIPNEDCLWTPTRTLSWSQTHGLVLSYASCFVSRGIKPNDIVAFYLQNSADFMIAWLALLAIGAAPAMINFNLEGKGLVHCVKVSGAKLLLVDEDLSDTALLNKGLLSMNLEMVVLTAAVRAQIEGFTPLPESQTVKANETSMLALRYTSGTTGFPKAVRTPQSRTYQLTFGKFSEADLRPAPGGDRYYICMPMCHATAGSTVMACMIMGITLCIGKKFSVSNFWPEIRASDATLFVYVGEVCRYLLTIPPSPDDKNHRIRKMYGNGLRPDVWKRFRDRFGIPEIDELFGSTEGVITMVNSARGDFLANAVGHHGAILRRYFNDVYVPIETDTETGEAVLDPETGFAKRLSYVKGGEVIVAVPSRASFLGYHNNPDATNKRFLTDVFRKGDLYYRCGDALKRTDDGHWQFLDRLGDTFRWKAENVSTAEVSEVLGRFPGVIDANVYGVEVPGYEGRAGCAALHLDAKTAKSFDQQALLRHALHDLPSYAVPAFLRMVDKPAMNDTHKQKKTQLREEGADPARTGSDRMYVLLNGQYDELTQSGWEQIATGKARL